MNEQEFRDWKDSPEINLMDKVLSRVLKDQEDHLQSLQEQLGNPTFSEKQAHDLNISAYILKHYIQFLRGLDFQSAEALEAWL